MQPRRRAKSCPNHLLAQHPQVSLVLRGKASKQDCCGVRCLAEMCEAGESGAILDGGSNEPILRIIGNERAAEGVDVRREHAPRVDYIYGRHSPRPAAS